MLRTLVISLFACALVLGSAPVFAMCGIDHNNSDAQTLMDAATALEETNPDLAAKVKEVAIKTFPEKMEAPAAPAEEKKEHGGAGMKEHGGN